MSHPENGPHQGQPLVRTGVPLEDARAAVVLLHGRGATARSIVAMAEEFNADDVAHLAPQAANNTWYPNPFTAPVETNEPGRTSGLRAIGEAIAEANEADIPTDRILIVGFSQGACLAAEYLARNPDRYGGLAVLSGGLIGETVDPNDYHGDLEGTAIFLGCSDSDPHIAEERVHESAAIFEALNGDVDTRLYSGMGHDVNPDEIDRLSDMVSRLTE